MKKQVLSLLLAGALTLGLFGCSAQTPEESGVPQSAPAQTEGTASAGVVEELKIGICKGKPSAGTRRTFPTARTDTRGGRTIPAGA